MKKSVTTMLILAMILLASIAWGQVTIWQDNFDDNDISNWTRTQTSSCNVQTGKMVFTRTGAVGTSYQYFTSPTINATAAENLVMDVLLTNYADSILDRCRVEVSHNGGTTWTEVTTTNVIQGSNYSLGISSYASSNFKLRIKYRLHNTASKVELDNIRITRQGVGISPSSANPVVGQQIQFSATGGLEGYVWTLTNPAVATITQAGLFTATAAGTTKVRVTSGVDWAETGDIVIDYMRITPNTASLWVGDTMQFNVEGGFGIKRFFSNNPAVVTITQQGFLTAVAVGSTTISVRDQNSVVVTSGPIAVSELSEFEPIEALVENTTYPHGPTRLGNSRNIAMTHTGIIYTAYQRGLVNSGRDVVIKKSLDGGATWTEIGTASALITNPRKQYQPAVAVDGLGHLHLTWFGDQTSAAQSYKIWYAKYNGSTWTNAVEISTSSSYVFPAIACDNLGNVLIAYTKQSGNNFVGPYYNKLWNNTWAGQVELGTSTVQNAASVTIDRANGLGVIAWPSGYSDPTAANSGRLAYVNPNGTLNGSVSTVLTGLNYDQIHPIFNSQSDLFLFYNLTSPDGGDVIHFRWRSNSDATWRRPLTFDGNTLETCFGSGGSVMPLASLNPQIAIDEYDNIYLFAEGKPTADDDWRIYRNICLADNNPNLDARYTINAWQTITNPQKLVWDAADDCAFVSVPEKLHNVFNIIPIVWSDGNLVNDGNTGHFPQGQHPGGDNADIRYKSLSLDYTPPVIGGVQGYVTLAGTQDPIHNAVVSLIGAGYSTVTDVAGFFELISIPVGAYTLRVIADGYYQTEQQVTILEGITITVNVNLEEIPLPTPQNLQADVAGNTVTLNWQAPTGGGGESVLLREGFEGSTTGWGSWDIDGDNNHWGIITNAGAAHSGEKMAGSNSYLNNQNLTPNNWLYTPMVQLGYGSTMKFWIGATNPQYYAEKYYLKMSLTDNTAHGNYTVTLLSETLPSANWREKVVDLSAWGGRTVSFAWQHTECTGQSQLVLDDVLITDDGSPNPNPETELSYDIGIASTYYQLNGGTMASRMSPSGACQILRLKFNTRTSPSVNTFNAEVWDWVLNPDTNQWQPGARLLQLPNQVGVHNAWTEIDVSSQDLNVSGDFLVGFGSINTQVGMGYSSTNNGRAWDYSAGAWSTWNETYHLRAIVQYANGRIAEIDSDGGSRELTGYKIYRNGTDISLVGTNQTTYTDQNVPDGIYTYGVTALHTSGSGESLPVTIQVQVGSVGPLPAPTNIQISTDSQHLILSWSAVTGATSYRVEASSNPSEGFTTLQNNIGATTYMIPLGYLSGTQKQFYRIFAQNSRSASSLPHIYILSQRKGE